MEKKEKIGEGWNQPDEFTEIKSLVAANPMPAFMATRKAPVHFDDARKERFLLELARTGLRSHSADVAGVAISTVRTHEKSDEEFARLCIEAKEYHADGLEAEAVRRATEGVLEPVFSQKTGEQIGVIRKYSDRLLEVLLRAKRPQDFRENVTHEHNHKGGVLVVPGATLAPEDWEAKFKDVTAGPAAVITEEK